MLVVVAYMIMVSPGYNYKNNPCAIKASQDISQGRSNIPLFL